MPSTVKVSPATSLNTRQLNALPVSRVSTQQLPLCDTSLQQVGCCTWVAPLLRCKLWPVGLGPPVSTTWALTAAAPNWWHPWSTLSSCTW
jgi:hypothetical protein